MRKIPRRFIPIIAVVLVGVIIGIYFAVQSTAQTNAAMVVSGTIEVTEINLGTQFGGRDLDVLAEEGQSVQAGDVLVEIRPGSSACTAANCDEKVRSPIDGVVLDRLIEPGELTNPGTTLMSVADLNNLTLTVYVPEDRYGQIYLGQTYPVTVDSFPGVVFNGTVSHISDQAEFTPRNVQTVEGRLNTVFAIRLSLTNTTQDLKPGMWADVNLGK